MQTPPEHSYTAAIDEAARWLVSPRERSGQSVMVEMRQRFGLTIAEAIEAVAQANTLRRKGFADAA